MKKTGLLALLLALAMLLTGCAANEEAQLKREVVRLGDASYTMEDLLGLEEYLRSYYDYMGQMYTMLYGYNPMTYTDDDIRTEALNSLALQVVVLNKADELKLDELTDTEKAELEATVDASMAEYRDSIAASLTFEENATEEEKNAAIEAAMAEEGITRDAVYKSEFETLMIERVQEWAVKDVTVSEDEFVTAFNEQVASEKTSYETDLSAYGAAILNGQTPVYAPAGYRNVKQILIQYTEEDTAILDSIDSALYTAQSNVSTANTNVTTLLGEEADVDALVAEVTVTLNEVTDPANITVKESTTAFTAEMTEEAAAAVKALAEARAIAAAYEAQQALATETALANIAPEADEVLTRLAAGEDWDALAAEFNDDPGMMEGSATAVTGYPICEGFYYFDEAFVNAAMALENIGEWSDKTIGETYGYYIIQYTSDVVEGEVDKETVRETMTAELLATKQEETFSTALDQWVADASNKLIINYDLLSE